MKHEGLMNWDLAKHLLAFTLTSPIAACVAYFGLGLLNVTISEGELMFWVAILLLVSAGSFLYVATIHILPEVFGDKGDEHSHTHMSLPIESSA